MAENTKINAAAAAPAPSAEDQSYVPIRAEGFASGSKSVFDVYVRLSSGRYLKLLQAGDQFTPDRLETYLKKGVTHFYIKKEMHESYLAYCRTLTTAVLNAPSLSTEIKMQHTLNQGEELMSLLKSQGVSEENIAHAKQFSLDVKNLTNQLAAGKGQSSVKQFLDDVAVFEHGVGTSMLAGILSHVVEIRMDKPVQIVGVASLLHDIGLSALPEECRNEDESQLNNEQRALFRTHPEKGAEILRASGEVDPAAIQAIEQHHMRHLGFGFPERTSSSAPLGRVAEIVGLCDEFNRLITKSKQDPSFSVIGELDKNVFQGFSRQIVYAFRSAFFPKR
jgi:putative nucleotidyltransferase with HDIG domain